MCGRYVHPDDLAIEREFNLVRQDWQFPPSFKVAPAHIARPVSTRVNAPKNNGAALMQSLAA